MKNHRRPLRTELFKTLPRTSTTVIAVRDTITQADPEIGPHDIDVKACRQGRFGIGVHFLIDIPGDIYLCRDVETIGSHSKNYDKVSVAVGLVGGLSEDGEREDTRTVEQKEALGDLLGVLQEMYPEAELNDHPFRKEG